MCQQCSAGCASLYPGLGKVREHTQLIHASVVLHHQAGRIVTNKITCVGQIITVTIRPLQNHSGQKFGVYRIYCMM
jgi:hypothetical protein